MYEKFRKIGWPSTLIVLLLMVGLLFSVAGSSFAEENISISAQATDNGVQFSVQGENIESFQLNVFTASGRSLFKSGSVRNNSVTWSLTDSSGNRVPFGIYLYRFAGKSSTGKVTSSGVAKIFVGPNQVTAETINVKNLSPMGKGGPPANKGNAKGVIKVPNDYSTIQGAIDSAEDGDKIVVYGGTYEELLTIDKKNISLIAQGDVIIENPDPAKTISNRKDTIIISNSKCTIEGFTVDVNGGWGGIYASGGPYYGTGKVEVTIKDNKILDYERNGITANGTLAKGRFIGNNMVIGQKDNFWANNGIQIGWGATGLIKGNTVQTNYWIGEEWTASGIMVFDAKNVEVMKNTVKDCETGIYVLGVNNKVVNNNLENDLEEETWGIVIGDPGPYLTWGLTYEESKNNKVISNAITGYDYEVIDQGEDSKVHANKKPLR